MSTHTIHLSPEHEQFVAGKIADGTCKDAEEVITTALAVLAREQVEQERKLQALRAAIEKGDASGIAEGDFNDVFARVLERAGHSRGGHQE